MKEYVEIQSTKSIVVTAGLQFKDTTNPDAHVPDRLKVAPLWPKLKIMIKKGKHSYPALIAEWPTVKALEKDGILTIGRALDEVNVEDEAKTSNNKLKKAIKEVAAKETVKDINLEDLSK